MENELSDMPTLYAKHNTKYILHAQLSERVRNVASVNIVCDEVYTKHAPCVHVEVTFNNGKKYKCPSEEFGTEPFYATCGMLCE